MFKVNLFQSIETLKLRIDDLKALLHMWEEKKQSTRQLEGDNKIKWSEKVLL